MPVFDEYLTHAEAQRWILEVDVAWGGIDAAVALTQPELLDQVRDSALIESYFPVYTTRLIRALWDDIDATSVFSIQLYESYKHFYVLNRYLAIVGYRPIDDSELREVRRPNLDKGIEDADAELARYMVSEHFAAYFFLRLSRQSREPVLAGIAAHIAKDEFRHTQFAYDLLAARLEDDPLRKHSVLRAASDFRHVGADVVESVPISEKNDLPAILTLNRRIRRLCGVSLSEYAKDGMHGIDRS
ncbi:MAG TPA: hypothetical protein VM791_08295 [Vicinamibacterales bacterium]|jgi:hypothetical protein|nr:hypothetical protein [Vicinamibacterales bacterium]